MQAPGQECQSQMIPPGGNSAARWLTWMLAGAALLFWIAVLATGKDWRDALHILEGEAKVKSQDRVIAYAHWGLYWGCLLDAVLCTGLGPRPAGGPLPFDQGRRSRSPACPASGGSLCSRSWCWLAPCVGCVWISASTTTRRTTSDVISPGTFSSALTVPLAGGSLHGAKPSGSTRWGTTPRRSPCRPGSVMRRPSGSPGPGGYGA